MVDGIEERIEGMGARLRRGSEGIGARTYSLANLPASIRQMCQDPVEIVELLQQLGKSIIEVNESKKCFAAKSLANQKEMKGRVQAIWGKMDGDLSLIHI